MNLNIGTSAVPTYQDLSFKLNFPTKKAGTFSVFGIGGASKIDIVVSKDKELLDNIYGERTVTSISRSQMGVTGVSHLFPINSTTFIRSTLAASYARSHVWHNSIFFNQQFEVDSLRQLLGYDFGEGKLSLTSSLTKKSG